MIEEHLQEILKTPPLALDEILSARERRADTQRQLLEEGQGTLICLTLNIAGAVKSAPLFTKAFEEGKSRILTQLRFERAEIGKCIERHERTGDELYLLVDLDLVTAKRRMVEIEEGFALGRLLDIDVMAKGVPKISRQQLGLPPRRCLVCGGDGGGLRAQPPARHQGDFAAHGGADRRLLCRGICRQGRRACLPGAAV